MTHKRTNNGIHKIEVEVLDSRMFLFNSLKHRYKDL